MEHNRELRQDNNVDMVFTMTDKDEEEEPLNQIHQALETLCNDYLNEFHHCTLDGFLTDIPGEKRCGSDVRLSDIYHKIEEARSADDPSLPRGVWERDLKKSDWSQVSTLALDTLLHRSRDVQLMVWFLEAEVRQQGFRALAPILYLFERIVEKYSIDLYPCIEQDELRQNIFRWLDNKLSISINHVSLLAQSDGLNSLSGVDLDRALVYEKLIESRQVDAEKVEGVTWQDFCALAEKLPDDHYREMFSGIENGIFALARLQQSLGKLFDESSLPTFHRVDEQLEKVFEFSCMELERRGLLHEQLPPEPEGDSDHAGNEGHHSNAVNTQYGLNELTKKPDREQIYQQLNILADCLAAVEPHSPVPNLLKRAVEWGKMSSAELYEELFLRHKGQLNVFDLVGIQQEKPIENRE